MAGKKSFFLTGANAKILLNNKTVAFATDVSYTVEVRHASPRVLGRFEVEVHQPLTYDVSGQMTIIRYSRGIKDLLGSASPENTDELGNGIGSFKLSNGVVTEALGLPTTDGIFDGGAAEALIPERFFQSKMFNIEIRQKLSGTGGGANSNFFNNLASGLVSSSATNPADNEATVILLRDCRIDKLDFRLSKRGVATQTISFRARYADDDTGIARKSGVGQQLS